MRRWRLGGLALFHVACSGADPESGAGAASSNAGALNPCAAIAEPAGEGAGAAPELPEAEASPYVTFVDCTTGFRTRDVHDADREIVRFDAQQGSMVSAASGDSVSGWTVTGADLAWDRSGVPFRVRFGTEAGERRAYFTEAGPGTICDLTLAGPEFLLISATRERPPNP